MRTLENHELLPKPARELVERLYREEMEDMVTFASRILQDHGLAEALVQDAFVIAMRRYRALMESPNPTGWLYQTLKNVMRHAQRDRAYLKDKLSPLEDVENLGAPSNEYAGDPLQGVDLSPTEIALLNDFYLGGFSLKELSEKNGITLGACKMRLRRAREKIRRFYDDNS